MFNTTHQLDDLIGITTDSSVRVNQGVIVGGTPLGKPFSRLAVQLAQGIDWISFDCAGNMGTSTCQVNFCTSSSGYACPRARSRNRGNNCKGESNNDSCRRLHDVSVTRLV